jgi:hypothetical protein
VSFCPKCGKELPQDAIYCPNCGERVVSLPPAVPAEAKRPGVITAASIICGILGGLEFLAAVSLFVVAGFLPRIIREIERIEDIKEIAPFVSSLAPGLLIGLGILALVFCALYIIACWHLWGSKRSGGIMAIVIAALSIIGSFIPFWGIHGFGLIVAFPVLEIAVIVLVAIGWSKLR